MSRLANAASNRAARFIYSPVGTSLFEELIENSAILADLAPMATRTGSSVERCGAGADVPFLVESIDQESDHLL